MKFTLSCVENTPYGKFCRGKWESELTSMKDIWKINTFLFSNLHLNFIYLIHFVGDNI